MPDWKAEIALRLPSLKLDPTREAEIVEELAQHLEDRYHELVSGGATPEEARRDLLLELNSLNSSDLAAQEEFELARRAPQEQRAPGSSGPSFFANLVQDLRYAL